MQPGTSVSLLWYITIGLDVILAVLVVRRRVFRSLPFFVLFVFFSILRSFLLWAFYRSWGFTSLPSRYAAWFTQGLLLVGRTTVCAELSWRILRCRPGLWVVARGVLMAVGLAIAAYAGLDSLHSKGAAYSFYVAAERGLELAIAVVLISLLLVAHRYSIRIQRTHFLLLTGLCFYSLVQTMNNALYVKLGFFAWWNSFRIGAFQIALLLWIWGVAKWKYTPEDKPPQLVPGLYDGHVEEVSQKLRSLDEQLEEIVRK